MSLWGRFDPDADRRDFLAVARDVELHQIVGATPLRPGVGMLFATGRAR